MSNFLAIAAATATLSRMIGAAIREAVPGAAVTTLRPDSPGESVSQPRVNLYLYQVVLNPAWRNQDLPTRNSDGGLLQLPQAALDLHYLLTFFGDEAQLEPQRLLARVVTALHAQPALTREAIRTTIQSTTASDPNHFLARSDLADQVELVRLSPLALNLEELSKMWSVLFQVPYALSVAYQGSVVLLEAEGAPQSALPVRAVRLASGSGRLPILDRVEPPTVEFADDAQLTLKGRNLSADTVTVFFDQIEAAAHAVADEAIAVRLPPGLRAGRHNLQVVHKAPPDSDGPGRIVRSNSMTFKLAPRITSPAPLAAARGETLTLQCAPAIESTQRAALLVGPREIASLPRTVSGNTLSFGIPPDFPAGDFLLRLRIDGVESRLGVDQNGRYDRPSVSVT